MSAPLQPPQTAALSEIHKQLDALAGQEGKGGASTAAAVVAMQAALLALYKNLLGIPTAK